MKWYVVVAVVGLVKHTLRWEIDAESEFEAAFEVQMMFPRKTVRVMHVGELV